MSLPIISGEGADFTPERAFIAIAPALVNMARIAAITDAHSYRGFNVGAAALAYDPASGEFAPINRGNLKARSDKLKFCAERKTIEVVKKSEFSVIAGLVVVATTELEQISEVNEHRTPTLHPCRDCREYFEESPLMHDDTLILTTGLDLDRYQVHTTKELYDLYDNEEDEKLENGKVAFGLSDPEKWKVRLANFDVLARAKQRVPESERRSLSRLAQTALLTPA